MKYKVQLYSTEKEQINEFLREFFILRKIEKQIKNNIRFGYQIMNLQMNY